MNIFNYKRYNAFFTNITLVSMGDVSLHLKILKSPPSLMWCADFKACLNYGTHRPLKGRGAHALLLNLGWPLMTSCKQTTMEVVLEWLLEAVHQKRLNEPARFCLRSLETVLQKVYASFDWQPSWVPVNHLHQPQKCLKYTPVELPLRSCYSLATRDLKWKLHCQVFSWISWPAKLCGKKCKKLF